MLRYPRSLPMRHLETFHPSVSNVICGQTFKKVSMVSFNQSLHTTYYTNSTTIRETDRRPEVRAWVGGGGGGGGVSVFSPNRLRHCCCRLRRCWRHLRRCCVGVMVVVAVAVVRRDL